MKLYIPCIICSKKANWAYIPGNKNYCDDCVPRSCSCNLELNEGIDPESEEAKNSTNYHEPLDKKGRRYPCCEYWEIEKESHDDPECVNEGWEAYYELHPEKRKESEEIEHWEKKLGVE